MSVDVGSAIFKSGMVDKVGVAEVETTHELFPFPVFAVAILDSGCRPMSDNVGAGMYESGIVENMWVAVEM